MLVPSSHRVTPCIGRRLQTFMEPLLGPWLKKALSIVGGTFPQGTNTAMAKYISQFIFLASGEVFNTSLNIVPRSKEAKGIYRPRLLMTGGQSAQRQGPTLAQALIYEMEHLPVHTLDVSALFAESARSPEEACVQVSFSERCHFLPLLTENILADIQRSKPKCAVHNLYSFHRPMVVPRPRNGESSILVPHWNSRSDTSNPHSRNLRVGLYWLAVSTEATLQSVPGRSLYGESA